MEGSLDSFKCFLVEYLTTIAITGANLLLPFFFSFLIQYEEACR
jgi:hypothetical protein